MIIFWHDKISQTALHVVEETRIYAYYQYKDDRSIIVIITPCNVSIQVIDFCAHWSHEMMVLKKNISFD